VQEPHKELVVVARSEVTMNGNAAPWPQQSLPWEEAARSLPNDQSPAGLEAYQFGFESPRIRVRPEFASYALQSFTPGRPMPESLLDLTARIHNDFRFDSKVTNVRTPTEEVFRKRRGCVPRFRALTNRLPTLGEYRGPLRKRLPSNLSPSRANRGLWVPMRPTPGRPRIVRESAGLIWIPLTNIVPSNGHVVLAWGRDYGDVSPLRGLILGGGDHKLKGRR
jgi:transglutaminase-like putative cysteine protease